MNPIADTGAPKIGPLDLFLAFSQLVMSGFGGVLPWAHRTLVEGKGWLTQREFVDALALGQSLPGPNIGNMAVMIGYRFAGGARGPRCRHDYQYASLA